MRRFMAAPALFAAALTGFAQDSVSRDAAVGDTVSPWAGGSAAGGSEQCNNYVVDLAGFQSSWGTPFRIAPLVKASRSGSEFLNSLLSAQSISRLQHVGVPSAAAQYQEWAGQGFGVNNDPALNTPGSPVGGPSQTNQFGITFAEFGFTNTGASYNGVIGGLINYERSNPNRLYVHRVMAAVNHCDPNNDVAQFGIGAVDESGNVLLRADCTTCAAGGCCPNVAGDNIFAVDLRARDCDTLNVLGGDAACHDQPATCRVIQNAGTVHNVPNLIPESVGGPTYIGTNFTSQYVYRTLCDLVGTQTTGHLASSCAAITDHRGAVGYLYCDTPVLGGNHLLGILGKQGGPTTALNLWGVDATGAITGTLALPLPQSLGDCDGFFNDSSGQNEFDHYHSQTAFRGGTAQVAIGRDQAGNILVAAQADHPNSNADNWPLNYIAVARFNPQDQAACDNVRWTTAGYIRTDAAAGKPILDGPGGNAIGEMVPLALVTGGQPLGPSVSSPMIDSVGNVYFLSAMRIGSDFTTGLLRAVYDPANFCYELELVFKLGDVFPGVNSQTNYLIQFLSIADSNSVSSGTAYSQNISQTALAARDPAALSPADSRTLGGLVINADIIYDVNDDGIFGADPNGPGGGTDESYQVLLYLQGEADAGCRGDVDGDGDVDLDDLLLLLTNFGSGAGGDVDGDGDTDLEDLLLLLGNFGCPNA